MNSPTPPLLLRYEQQLQAQRMRLVADADLRMEGVEASRCGDEGKEGREDPRMEGVDVEMWDRGRIFHGGRL